MRKFAFWAAAFAVAAGVVGCGGSGGSSSSSSNNGGGGTTVKVRAATVNLPVTYNSGNAALGTVEVTFLTGSGRATGDISPIITRVDLIDDFGTYLTKQTPGGPLLLTLTNYNAFNVALDAPVTSNSNLYSTFLLDPANYNLGTGDSGSIQLQNTDSTTTTTYANYVGTPYSAATRIRVLPGRFTSVPIFLDERMWSYTAADTTNGTPQQVTFNTSIFQSVNQLANSDDVTINNKIASFLNDYVRFDLTAMDSTLRPVLKSGAPAGNVFFSGDNMALSVAGDGNPSLNDSTAKNFEVLTTDPLNPIEGFFSPAFSSDSTKKGTFTLRSPNPLTGDPTNLDQASRVTSLQGYWRDFLNVLSGVGSFEFVVFPGSSTDDPSNGQAMAVAFTTTTRSGKQVITNFYWGYVNLKSAPNHTGATGEFTLMPASKLTDVVIDPTDTSEISGTLSSYLDKYNASTTNEPSIRFGTYKFDSGQTIPTGFLNTGNFVVFRK